MVTDLPSGLHVMLDETGKQLRAVFSPQEGSRPPDRAAIRDALSATGRQDARLDESAIVAFMNACHRGTEPVEAIIGEVLDGYFELEIDGNELAVNLTVFPPEGGLPVTALDVRTALASRGIVVPPDEAVLRQALDAGRGNRVPVVMGTPPGAGQPARFVNLLEARRPGADDDDARIDLRELGNLMLVKPGTPLMRRIPAVPGTAGQDVYGRVLPAPEIQDHPFSDRLTGVAPGPNDPELLLAAVAGMPSLRTRGISVNPVVDVEAVDLQSGNIDFDGTLRVNGDIKTGMSVRVAGDVIVSGTIEAAHVEAGGNVVVKGGIIGKAESAPQQDPASVIARVHCKGSVHARFIENAVVEAGTTVVAETGIRQSDVAAGDSIRAGDPKAGIGNITGGRCRAMLAVRTATLGAPAGTATIVQVGVNPYAEAEKNTLEATRQRLQQEQDKVQQLVTFFAKHPEKATDDLREKARGTLFKYTRDLLDVDARIAHLAQQLQPTAAAQVLIGKKIHGGVTVFFGHKQMRILEDKPGGRLRLVDDRIALV